MLLSIIALLNVSFVQNAQGLEPHIVTGKIYEANGSVVVNCTTVTITNARTGESSNTTGNVTGVYAFNLLNLPSGWAYGDTIQIKAYNATNATGTNSTQLLVGLLSTTIDIWIGTTQAVSGINFYVLDTNNEEANGAMVNVKDSNGDIIITKVTDSDGKTSATLADGLYTITVGGTGFDDTAKNIRVHGSDTYTIILGEAEAEALLTDIWSLLLMLFALVGIIFSLMWVLKKVR